MNLKNNLTEKLNQFKKPKKEYVSGETRKYIHNKYSNSNKIVLYFTLGRFLVLNKALVLILKLKKKDYVKV